MEITADDKLIWDLGTGSRLTATKDLVMEDGDRERSFTAGKTYRVKSMHPIAEPAYVVLIDDQGADHKMHGEHIREFFGHSQKTLGTTAICPECGRNRLIGGTHCGNSGQPCHGLKAQNAIGQRGAACGASAAPTGCASNDGSENNLQNSDGNAAKEKNE